MKQGSRRWSWIGILALSGLLADCQTGPLLPSAEERGEAAQAVIGNWSDLSRLSAARLIEEHGAPDEVESSRLVWHHRGLLDSIAVSDTPPTSDGSGNVESTVAYAVPGESRPRLSAFDHQIQVSRDGSKLSARSIGEATNFLAINLADEIIRGLKTPEEARDFYDQVLQRAAAGKTSPFLQGLLFLPTEVRRH